MAKKPTLTHVTEDGVTATRQSARPYTHVLLERRGNVELAEKVIRATASERIADATRRAIQNWDEYSHVATVKVGDMIPYTWCQGGCRSPRNSTYAQLLATGAKHDARDYEIEIAQGYVAEHKSREGAIADACRDVLASIEKEVARQRARDNKWYVVSWHSHPKHAKPQYPRVWEEFKVEAINGGVRS